MPARELLPDLRRVTSFLRVSVAACETAPLEPAPRAVMWAVGSEARTATGRILRPPRRQTLTLGLGGLGGLSCGYFKSGAGNETVSPEETPCHTFESSTDPS